VEKHITLAAGQRDCENLPVSVKIEGAGKEGEVNLVDDKSAKPLPVQTERLPDNSLLVTWIAPEVKMGQERTFSLYTGACGAMPATEVRLKDAPGERVDVTIGGKLFTSYNYAPKWVRPFLHPVIGPGGVAVTRGYPVLPDVPGESKDHPHHKSIWVAWGDVNGTDNWSEVEARHGRQIHKQFDSISNGPVFGRLCATNDWVSKEGKKDLTETRTWTFYNLPDKERIIDLVVEFKATEGQVRFGDTKEGGICSVRVTSTMDAKAQGRIENAYGGINERETWGKRSHWCDYSGPAQGKQVGIAVFDTPGNFRYPTYWHVRDYGLMTANPFGLSHFWNDKSQDGSYTLPANATLRFAYRIYLHQGDASKGRAREKFLNYVAPPIIKVK
jgi:hypothetical protein